MYNVFANLIGADLGMKLRKCRNSRSGRKQIFRTDEISLSIDISDWEIIPRFFANSFGDIVFQLRLMLTETLIIFELNRRYSVLSGFTDSLFPIIQEKAFLMQDLIEEKAAANSSEKDRYIWVWSA